MSKIIKCLSVFVRFFIGILEFVHVSLYMKVFTFYLICVGVRVLGKPKYISRDVYFDGSDYSLITLGDNVVISREVMFLTHDYSLTAGLASIGDRRRRTDKELYFLQPIEIGKDCFIGARVSILPGIIIGDNVIIGAGCVVSKSIASDSIVVGNPCRVIGKTSSWVTKRIKSDDFLET